MCMDQVESASYIKDNTEQFWKATAALGVGGFAIFSNLHITQPLLPLFTEEYGVSAAVSSLSVSLIIFSLSIFLLVFGPVSDAVGRKNMMVVGLFVSSLLSISIFFVPNFWWLLVMRALQGVALATLPAIAYAYIGEEYDLRSIGTAIGIYISLNSIGGLGGRVISGFAADMWGWRYSFLAMGLVGFLCLAIFLALLPDSKHFKPHRFCLRGAAGEIFMHIRNPVLRRVYYIAAILFFVFVGLFNYLGYHLHQAPYFLSTTIIGLLYLSYLAGTFSSTLSGRLDQVFTIPQRVVSGLGIMILGIILMITSPLWSILLGLVVLSFGFFFAHSASSSWVSRHAREAKGSASALYLFAYYMGGSVGSLSLGWVWEPWGWKAVTLVCIVLILLAVLFALWLKEPETSV